jgi:hypothetical protein
MPNRQLTNTEIKDLFRPLYESVTSQLQERSKGDAELLWDLRRKFAKSLIYDERGTPMQRRRLKLLKRAAQQGLCAIRHEPLPDRDYVLDRFEAMSGYTLENARVICRTCDFRAQSGKKLRNSKI